MQSELRRGEYIAEFVSGGPLRLPDLRLCHQTPRPDGVQGARYNVKLQYLATGKFRRDKGHGPEFGRRRARDGLHGEDKAQERQQG